MYRPATTSIDESPAVGALLFTEMPPPPEISISTSYAEFIEIVPFSRSTSAVVTFNTAFAPVVVNETSLDAFAPADIDVTPLI